MHETTFDYLKPTDEQIAAMAEVRRAYKGLAAIIERLAPPSRYRSLAMTELEASAMWANKAITRDGDGAPR